MSITIVRQSDFEKFQYNVQTGAGTYNLPREDVDALYGPGWPIQPITRPEDSELPRTLDYPVGVNYTLQPRVGYDGLMPIRALKAAYINVTEVATPVNLIIRELSAFVPILRNKTNHQRVKDGSPYDWMIKYPDGDKRDGGKGTPFNVWMARFKKSAKVYAAPAFYKRRVNGKTMGMEFIDGSTLFLIINDRGDLPEPGEVDPEIKKFLDKIKYSLRSGDPRAAALVANMPSIASEFLGKQRKRIEQGKSLVTTTPAFTQIIKGIPFSFWDKSQVYFVPEPPAPAVDSPYGESYIERAWTWVNIIAVLTAFELGHYRTGNMPEGFATMPKDWFPSMGKLATAEREFNARMAEGSQVQHSRIRFGPENMKWIPTKKPDFPDKLYAQANGNILHAIGVPESELGKKPSQGLGGKGFEQGAAHDVTRQILEAEKTNLENPFNHILMEDGADKELEVYMDYPQEEVDPAIQSKNLNDDFVHGLKTMNDILTAQDREPIGDAKDPDNLANMHIIQLGNNLYVFEKLKIDPNGIVAPAAAQPGADGGPPIGPEDAIAEDAGGKPPADAKAVRKLFQIIEESGGKSLSTTTYSIPEVIKADADKALDAGAGYDGYNLEGADDVDANELAMGIAEEQEHADTVGNDQAVIRQIALDHLREDPHYYTHLKQVTKADITGHEGAMVAIFMPDNVARELRKIADGLGLPADAQQELAENMHITLAFLPDFDQAKIHSEEIVRDMKVTALSHGKIYGNIQGFGVFNGQGGSHVLYATLDCADLPFIRTQICDLLGKHGQAYALDHGFVPHITLAYFPDKWELPAGFSVPDMKVEIDGITLAIGNELTTVTFAEGATRLGKFDWPEYFKHCGVCPEDESYFGAPISREIEIPYPAGGHTNDLEIVAMTPEGLPPKPALWFPAGGENLKINARIGGPQYKRREASWLLSQSLGFPMIPLAYVGEVNEEEGAVVWYTMGGESTNPKPANEYAPEWIEKAGIFDYIDSEQDRPGDKLKNYLTHPDDPTRIILIDNSYSWPEDVKMYSESVFTQLMVNKPLSPENIAAIKMCLGDASCWSDIEELIGPAAVAKARTCAQRLVDEGMITPESEVEKGWITVNGNHVFIDDNKTGIGHNPTQGKQIEDRLLHTTDARHKNPGVSMNIHTGTEPTTGYALSVHPELSQPVENWRGMSRDEKIAALESYVTKNNGPLSQSGNHLGLWVDKSTGTMWIDTSTVVQDPHQAEQLAVQHNQIAYWDILNHREVRTGGTGAAKAP